MTEVNCAFLDRRAEAWWSFVQQKSLDRTSRPMMLLPKDKKKRQKKWNIFRNPKNQNEEFGLLSWPHSRQMIYWPCPLFRIFFIYSYSIAFLEFILKSIFILYCRLHSLPNDFLASIPGRVSKQQMWKVTLGKKRHNTTKSAGRHFRTKLMSQYTNSCQKILKKGRIQDFFLQISG